MKQLKSVHFLHIGMTKKGIPSMVVTQLGDPLRKLHSMGVFLVNPDGVGCLVSLVTQVAAIRAVSCVRIHVEG